MDSGNERGSSGEKCEGVSEESGEFQ